MAIAETRTNEDAAAGSPESRSAFLRTLSRWPVVCALLSAGLMYLSFFPVGWGWLGWVAVVPLLALVRSPAHPFKVYLAAWLCGLAFYYPVLQWMRLADERMVATWALTATYGSFYIPAVILLLRRVDRLGLSLAVTAPVVWTALDFFRANFMGGFAWDLLGNTQHNYPGGLAWYFLGYTQQAFLPVIQIADLAGIYGVTFLVLAGNGVVFEYLYSRRQAAAQARFGLRTGLVFAIALVAVLTYGWIRLAQQDDQPGPRVALLQGNLDQRIKDAVASGQQDSAKAVETIAEHYDRLCRQAVATQPDLIVWPETSYPDEWVELDAGFPVGLTSKEWQAYVAKLPADAPWRQGWAVEVNEKLLKDVARWGVPTLLGLNVRVFEDKKRTRRYNSAVLFSPASFAAASSDSRAAAGLTALLRYDKVHRVPFGEYVPFRDELPWLNKFAPYDFDYSIRPGEQFTRFPLGKFRFGVLICFEDTDPNLARQYGKETADGPAVDFLVNISNDGWFIGSAEHDEHLAQCRFRAVECRRSVARAVNMGISALIDGSGRIVALPGPSWAESKQVDAVISEVVPLDRRQSLYARFGDWLPIVCWLGVIAGVCWPRTRP